MERTRRDESALTALCLIGYFFIGSLVTLFPSIMPAIIKGFGLSLASAGAVFPANSVGSLIGGMLAGVGSDRIGRKPFFCGSALLSGLGLLGAFAAPNWPLFVGAFLLVGMGQGALSNSINALALDLNSARQGKALNALHGLYSLGAMLSPFVIKWALGPGKNWRTALLVSACLWLLLSLLASIFRYPSTSASRIPRRSFQFALLKNVPFALLFFVAFLYNGVAWSLLGWVKEHLQQVGAKPGFASGMISLFYLGLTAGRFACATLSERIGYGKTLTLCAFGTTLAYPLATFVDHPAWIALGVFLCGLFLSGLYPTALAYATRLFPTLPGTVTGTLSIGMTLGAALPPWWTGVLGGFGGLSVALRLNYLLVIPLIGISLSLRNQERRERSELPSA